ncbi:MAG: YggS family pyridoxal phosphate-dependent enzyme [Deltaproteobacteria bacterium]|nr:YggS family pyridoxal phosphate-dependent enzyme [Deltaproteobacteria bacterium]
MVKRNLDLLRARIADAASRAGRDPQSVRIVAAAKTQNSRIVEDAVRAGVTIIGHNYVQEAVKERPRPDECGSFEYHMIGHLQRNKARKAVEIFDVIQTIDDSATAAALDHAAHELGRRLGVLIQINLANEPQKSGVPEMEALALIQAVESLRNLKLLGLMTMPPFFDDPDAARPFFRRLRGLRDDFISRGFMISSATELSMGMTGDFEVAVEEGATLVRIGTALFGPRG